MQNHAGAVKESWGRYPAVTDQEVVRLTRLEDLSQVWQSKRSLLPAGMGRSYGDSCLNDGGLLIDTCGLNRLIAFDPRTGVLRCEAGTTLAQIIEFAVPRGWFLPTTPGTKFVTVGGAIANDVHGKNHHVAGTFGRHVTRFELLRSDGSRLLCSPDSNGDLYRATIGGLGLTGLITWAEVRLKPISGPFIDMESLRFGSLDEFFDVAAATDRDFEYAMAWVDCVAGGRNLGRGLYMRGNDAWQPRIPGKNGLPRQRLAVPLDLPGWLLNGYSLKAFNALHYYSQVPKRVRKTVPFDPFFYPLDAIGNWNRMYGRRGFLQHQCVVPHESAKQAISAILRKTGEAGEGSFLAVLKIFGDLPSPGIMSFPRPGSTLALDFPYRGERTLRLLDQLDEIVLEHGGAVYPAKDARMSPRVFEASFPQWREFEPFVDERFSSSFWRRVTNGNQRSNAS